MMMKKTIMLLTVVITLYSCEKSDEIHINTTFNHQILAGYDVTSIAFDNLGNAWIGTFNAFWPGVCNKPELIKYNTNTKEVTIYNSSNSLIADSMYIWDIAVDKKNNIWIGCDGLIKFDGTNFTKYSSKNSEIPIDFVHSIEVDSKNNIWFSSCSHLKGGLVRYDGTNWTVFTPENSALPMNGVKDIAIDQDDNIWLAQYGSIGVSCLVNISGDLWTTYPTQDLGFSPASWDKIVINNKNQVCGSAYYTGDNVTFNPRPQVIVFDGISCKMSQFDSYSNLRSIAVDHKNNIWGTFPKRFEVFDNCIAVFDGKKWLIDSLTFSNTIIETIKLSKDNKIWVGTGNGVFIND